jgi:plasmid stabilization system protein ParE
VVSWSLRARTDLKAIHDHISKDSPINAKTVVREIVGRANLIDQTPRWPEARGTGR